MRLGRDFRLLALASAVSTVGDGVTLAALPLLALGISTDPRAVSGVVVAAGLPWLLASIPAGALVDWVDRRRLMVWVDVIRAALMAVLAAAAGAGRLTFPLIYLLVFLLGTGQVLFANAYQALLPELVDRTGLERGNGALSAIETVASRFAGPPVGALLFVLHPAAPCNHIGRSSGAMPAPATADG
jgi:MFS family permease